MPAAEDPTGRRPDRPRAAEDVLRSVRIGRRVVLVMVGLQTAGHLAFLTIDGAGLLDVNREGGVGAVVAAAVLLVAAAGAFQLRRQEHQRADRVLGGILVFLALDELLVIHERVGIVTARVLGLSDAWDSVLWPLMYLPLLGLVLALLLLLARQVPRPAGRAIRTGLGLLVGAVSLEVLSAPFSTPTTASGLVHSYEGMVEEALELGGWGLIATGLVDAAIAVRQTSRRR
jgi:uncharacterized membrane protein YidH (DUF202 family)